MKPEILEQLTWRDIEEIYTTAPDYAVTVGAFSVIFTSENPIEEFFTGALNKLKERNAEG